MVAIVYSRVSSEDQAKTGFSLATQVDAGRRRALELGATEVITFADEGVPGDLLERPGLQQALEAIRRGGAALFICHDPDRLARNLSLQLLVTDQIERAGTRLEFVNFDYKNTPEGQLFYSLRGAIAQFEKAKIRERTMRGKRQKAREGGLTHNPCTYGYDFDPTTDSLHVNQDEAQIVCLIFKWFLTEDLGPWAIAIRLTEMGIAPQRGGSTWHHSSVRAILRNASYTGTLYQQKWDYTDTRLNKYRPKGEKVRRKHRPESEWLPVAIPAIIDKEQSRDALAKLENARRWWSGWHREAYLLKGLCECAICGRPIYGASRQSGKRRIRYYVCRGYAPGAAGAPRCAFGRVRADEIEDEVWNEVRNLIEVGDRIEELLSRQCDESHLQAQAAVSRKQLAEALSENERTVRLVVRGNISQELGEKLLKEQQQRITRLMDDLSKLERQNAGMYGLALQARAGRQVRCQFRIFLDQLDFAGRQQVVRAFVKTVALSREETTIHLRLAPLRRTDLSGEPAGGETGLSYPANGDGDR